MSRIRIRNSRGVHISTCLLAAAVITGSIGAVGAQYEIVIEKPFIAKALEGIVVDQAGGVISGAEVELTTPDGKRTLQSTVTDSKGWFIFPKRRNGKYFLNLSKPNFNPMRICVVVDGKQHSELKIEMEVAK